MSQRDHSVLREILPLDERAIEAVVARYQRIAPAVLRFARTIANNEELQVRLGSQAAVAKNHIIIDPRVFQAAYSRAAPVTPTEVALTSALHEVVHMLATDFGERRPVPESWLPEAGQTKEPVPTPIELASPDDLIFLEDGDEEIPIELLGDEAEATRDAPFLDAEGKASLPDALHLAGGSAAGALFVSIEDARQELQLLSPYGGVRSVLQDLYRAALPDALREARPLGQFALACFMQVGRYYSRNDLEAKIAPAAATALDDASVWLDQLSHTDDPWDVAEIALELLKIAKIHGLVREAAASDSETIKRAKQEADKHAIAESVDAVRIVSPPLADVEAYEQTRQANQSVSAHRGRQADAEQAGDPATDQLVRVSEAPTVFLPTGQGGKLIVETFPSAFQDFAPEGRKLLDETARRWGVAQRQMSGELYPLFLANQRRGLHAGYDAGDLSPHAALLLGAGLYERMFERRDLPTRRSYAISLLIDGSASMLQPRTAGTARKAPWALAAATLGAWALARLADELQIEFEIALFNRAFVAELADTELSYNKRSAQATGALRRNQGGSAERLSRTVNHYLLKRFDDRWRSAEDTLAGLFCMAADPAEAVKRVRFDKEGGPPISMFEKAANVDEYNIAYAAKRLAARGAKHRIIVVLADGMTRGSVGDLAECVHAIEAGGTMVLGIGIGDDTVRSAYARHRIVDRPETLASAMVDGVRSALHTTVSGTRPSGWWLGADQTAASGPGSGEFMKTMRSISA